MHVACVGRIVQLASVGQPNFPQTFDVFCEVHSSLSSLPSKQSLVPSHTFSIEMQVPLLAQRNLRFSNRQLFTANSSSNQNSFSNAFYTNNTHSNVLLRHCYRRLNNKIENKTKIANEIIRRNVEYTNYTDNHCVRRTPNPGRSNSVYCDKRILCIFCLRPCSRSFRRCHPYNDWCHRKPNPLANINCLPNT